MVKDRIFYTTKSGKQILSQKKDDLNAAPDQEYPKEAGNDSNRYTRHQEEERDRYEGRRLEHVTQIGRAHV